MGIIDTAKELAAAAWEAGSTAPAALAGAPAAQNRAADWPGFNPAYARSSGEVFVTASSVGGVPAFERATRIAAAGVAGLNFGVWRGEGPELQQVTTVWQHRLFEYPNAVQSPYDFLEAIERSLTTRNNAYVFKLPGDVNILELWALHPDQVAVTISPGGDVRYTIQNGAPFLAPFGPKRMRVTVEAGDMLHIRNSSGSGLVVAPTPVQVFRDTFASAIAKVRHEERTFAHGTMSKLGIELPADVGKERAKELKELWQETNAGPENAGKAAVIGGGGKIVTIGLNQKDAQFVESMALSAKDIAMIADVEPFQLGAETSSLSAEDQAGLWFARLIPRLQRIENAFRHDPDLFGRGSRVRPRFRSEEFNRTDPLTSARISIAKVQAGIWTADEARLREDNMGPLPNGQGAVAQITPVGGSPNPTGPLALGPGTDNNTETEE